MLTRESMNTKEDRQLRELRRQAEHRGAEGQGGLLPQGTDLFDLRKEPTTKRNERDGWETNRLYARRPVQLRTGLDLAAPGGKCAAW